MTAELPRRLEYLPLSTVEEAARNPRTHDREGIAAAINRHGLGELPLLDERTGRLVAGHGRIRDLRDRYGRGQDPPGGIVVDDDGEWRVPIIRGWASTSDDAAVAYLVGSNDLIASGGWDMAGLAELLTELRDADPSWLEAVGHTSDDLDDMLALLEPPDLDGLGKDLGDPSGSDTWPVVRVKVPVHLHAAWRTVVDRHDGDEVKALGELLDVDPDGPVAAGPVWEPDRMAHP